MGIASGPLTPDRPVIAVRGLSKKYCAHLRTSLWYGLCDIAAELWPRPQGGLERLREKEFWSLRDLSFDLHPGESLAIIGGNGAGKSTLLKLLHGLIRPDGGSIRTRGRVGALIELGAGLDPALTGRENILLRAALLGVSRAELRTVWADIVEFTGLGDAIGTPVRFYSSGMVARLAYAVGAHLHPDVLLVDEVLAVGDFDFQRKCIQHMMGYLAGGGSLILVSHQAQQIQAVCRRGLVLEKGRMMFAGTATDALDYYFTQGAARGAPKATEREPPLAPSKTHPVVIEQLTLSYPGRAIQSGDDLPVTLICRSLRRLENVSWGICIFTRDGEVCITNTYQPFPMVLPAGLQTLSCRLLRLPLTAGEYQVRACLFDLELFQPIALLGWQDAAVKLRVESLPSPRNNMSHLMQQLVTIESQWNV